MIKNLFKVTLPDSDRTTIQAESILSDNPGFPDGKLFDPEGAACEQLTPGHADFPWESH